MDIAQLLAGIKSQFQPTPKRVWPAINRDSIVSKVVVLKAKRLQEQDAILQKLMGEKPPTTADVPLQTAWHKRYQAAERAKETLLQEFDAKIAQLIHHVDELGRSYYAAYESRYADWANALESAWQNAVPQIEPLADRQVDLEEHRGKLLSYRADLISILYDFGAHIVPRGLEMTGWDTALRRAFLEQACAEREISPDHPPPSPDFPRKPSALKIDAQTALKEKTFTFLDGLMCVGGLAFGSSIGAAMGSISFSSDGWEFAPIFWMMLGLGVFASYVIGKAMFPRLVTAIVVDTLDFYDYVDEKSPQEIADQKKAQRSARNAVMALTLIFIMFLWTDAFGWWRAATEHNLAVAGDEGAAIINPYAAASAVATITSIFAAAKLASLFTAANALRRLLVDEIRENASEYGNKQEIYRRDLEKSEKQKVIRDNYDDMFRHAEANVDYRMASKEVTALAGKIATYEGYVEVYKAELAKINSQIQAIAMEALQQTTETKNKLDEEIQKIDYIHAAVAKVMAQE